MNSLRIMAWNADGIIKHANELEATLKIGDIDICLISETHLTNHTFVNIKNYETHCTNHPSNNARGGSAILIKRSIKHHEEDKYSTEEFQTTTISVQVEGIYLAISALYSPPKHKIKHEQYKQLLSRYKGRFIIGGDFNAKNIHWGSRLTTTKGRELHRALKEMGCEVISTGNPTYWPTDRKRKPDLIDFFITKQITRSSLQIEDGVDMNSDHSPIYLTLNGEVNELKHNPRLTNKYTDWAYFKSKLNDTVDVTKEISTIADLEREVETFTQQIQDCAWYSTPVVQKKNFHQNYPPEIIELIKNKRKLRKTWQRTRYPLLKTHLNYMSKLINQKIKEIKNVSFNKHLQNLTPDKNSDYSLWKSYKNIHKPIMQNPPIKHPNGTWAKSDQEKAEAFAVHLSHTFQSHDIQGIVTTETTRDESIVQLFTTLEVEAEIKNNLKLNKSPGFDLVTAEILKNLPLLSLVKVKDIMNACILLKHVPLYWKVSEVIMIQKPGKDPNEVSSYRPISLLPIMSKLFEKLFIKRIKVIVENQHLVPNHQFGFREKHSTIDQVHRLSNTIEEALESKKVCSAIFLDVAQAFDKVWHQGLVEKLTQLLPRQHMDILVSYLSNRFFRIKKGHEYSKLYPIKTGVPQGSILGPLLYILFTSDMPTPTNCMVATFADDTCILTTGQNEIESTHKLQQSLNCIIEWTSKWHIKLNEAKSSHINFTNKKIRYIPITIQGCQIPYCNTAKYLGMNLDAKLKWDEHVKKKAIELNLKFNKLKWLIGRNSSLSIQNKLLVYNQTMKPVWTYGIQLWGCAKQTQIEIIQRIQNKVLRCIVNAPWYIRNTDLHRDLGVKTVKEVIQEHARTHAQKLQQHINPEASILSDTTRCTRRLKRTKPHDLF